MNLKFWKRKSKKEIKMNFKFCENKSCQDILVANRHIHIDDSTLACLVGSVVMYQNTLVLHRKVLRPISSSELVLDYSRKEEAIEELIENIVIKERLLDKFNIDVENV